MLLLPDQPLRSISETLRGLVVPRRLVPIAVVCLPLLVAQWHFSRADGALSVGFALCLGFVFVGPVCWRLLLPDGLVGPAAWLRLLLYTIICLATGLGLGLALPWLLGIGITFLTDTMSLVVCLALFLVGGWGLGRDISFELRLEREQARAEALAREAERSQLLALRAQLDPHFLFNTLNAIAEWCREDGVVAERAVLQLSSILRSVLLGVKAQSWPLRQELELVDTLFCLHQLRDPDLFQVSSQIDASLGEVLVPPLILLPLAENAAKHGPCAGHCGQMFLSVSRQSPDLVVVIENPGPFKGPRPGSSGLPHLQQRLALAYLGTASLRVFAHGERTRAELRLPLDGPTSGVIA